MKLKIAFTGWLIIITTALLAQGRLSGTVSDTDDGELPFAHVVVFHNGIQKGVAQTDFDGKYAISLLDPGKYKVVVSYVGYADKIIEGIIIYQGKTTRLNVEMRASVELQEVTVYGKKIVELDKTSTGMEMTAEQIEKAPARNVKSLVGGTQYISSSDDGRAMNLGGGRPGGNVVMVNGVKMNSSSLPALPMSAIKELQVISGGIPAQYGSAEEMQQHGLSSTTFTNSHSVHHKKEKMKVVQMPTYEEIVIHQYTDIGTESYIPLIDNPYKKVTDEPLSTFSIDVDGASYSNARRFIESGVLPPKDAVRVEEFINYFSYDYPQPEDEHPFSIYTEVGICPWNEDHKLVHIGLQGKEISVEETPAMNLVFLIDVSGSMSSYNKLPLVKKSLQLLSKNLREQDRISIVVYAGAAGLVLPPTAGNDEKAIMGAINRLSSGGSTAGGQGLQLAYSVAQENLMKDGINRIILAADGDFNVGVSDDESMKKLVEQEREKGIFITVLGYGMGNYKDSKMEVIADHGNGNYFYIDNFAEARKVLLEEMAGTLNAIAKDVKLQLEFNPNEVAGYRLIGYANRLLKDEDFNNDRIDAGDLGSGHTVTALYEVVPVNSKSNVFSGIDELKYQNMNIRLIT